MAITCIGIWNENVKGRQNLNDQLKLGRVSLYLEITDANYLFTPLIEKIEKMMDGTLGENLDNGAFACISTANEVEGTKRIIASFAVTPYSDKDEFKQKLMDVCAKNKICYKSDLMGKQG